MEKIAIIGAGGHARVIHDIVVKEKRFEVVCFFAKDVAKNQTFLDLPVFNQDDLNAHDLNKGLVAIGDNWQRSRVVEAVRLKKSGFTFVSVVHPSASVGLNSKIGAGSVVMPGAVVGANTQVGEHCIINTQASIDHDGCLEDYSSIGPGATLGGSVSLGAFSAISLGANVIHGRSIGAHTVVGAGATVLTDLASHQLAFGTPCRAVRERQEGESYL